MRRILLGLSAAALTFGVSAWLISRKAVPPAVPHGSTASYTSPNHQPVSYTRNSFINASQATDEFNEQLRIAVSHEGLNPCFGPDGQRVGERAVMSFGPPYVPEPTWRIVWTQQAKDTSEIFWVESVSLPEALHFETINHPDWKRCDTRK